jgi:hypothetical protein
VIYKHYQSPPLSFGPTLFTGQVQDQHGMKLKSLLPSDPLARTRASQQCLANQITWGSLDRPPLAIKPASEDQGAYLATDIVVEHHKVQFTLQSVGSGP